MVDIHYIVEPQDEPEKRLHLKLVKRGSYVELRGTLSDGSTNIILQLSSDGTLNRVTMNGLFIDGSGLSTDPDNRIKIACK